MKTDEIISGRNESSSKFSITCYQGEKKIIKTRDDIKIKCNEAKLA